MPNVFRTPEQRKNWNKYNQAYSKKNYVSINIKLHREKDKDIIEYLTDKKASVSEKVRKLVREGIK